MTWGINPAKIKGWDLGSKVMFGESTGKNLRTAASLLKPTESKQNLSGTACLCPRPQPAAPGPKTAGQELVHKGSAEEQAS